MNQRRFQSIIIIIAVVIFAAIVGYFIGTRQTFFQEPAREINSFEECAKAGYPVGESYPRQCWTPDGRNFVEKITIEVVKEIKMTAANFSFSPKSITVQKGEPVKIFFTNVGIHTFTIDELGVDVPLRGFSPVAEFTPTKTGTFEYYCKIPGHREAGQVGTITIE